MNRIILLIPLFLSACGGMQATQYTTSDGKPGYKLTCSEFNTTLEACKAKAGEVCATGYVINQSYRETYPDSGDGIYRFANNHLVFTCNTPKV
jgi:hypothetical protein